MISFHSASGQASIALWMISRLTKTLRDAFSCGAALMPSKMFVGVSFHRTAARQKVRAATDAAPTNDLLSVAILVAMNIADECFRARQQQSSSDGQFNERALRLEQLVDQVLSQAG